MALEYKSMRNEVGMDAFQYALLKRVKDKFEDSNTNTRYQSFRASVLPRGIREQSSNSYGS